MKKVIFILIVSIFVLSCSLEHSNPLDPENSGISAPDEITGIIVTLTTQNHVNISWNSQPDSDGYFLYRSYSEDGQYDTLPGYMGLTSSFLDEITITNYNCWYKVSAYKLILIDNEEEILEGIRSAPHTWD